MDSEEADGELVDLLKEDSIDDKNPGSADVIVEGESPSSSPKSERKFKASTLSDQRRSESGSKAKRRYAQVELHSSFKESSGSELV